MKRTAALVLLLLLLLPAATALSVSPAAISSSDGTLLVRWDQGQAGALHVRADHISGVLSDSVKEDRIDSNGAPISALEYTGPGHTSSIALPSGEGYLSLVRSASTTLLIQPISDDFSAKISGGPVDLRSVKSRVLESNHAYDDPDAEFDSPHNYVYRVHDVVAATTSTTTNVRVEGDFILYIWNATILQESPGGAQRHHTGTWAEPGSAPGLKDIHFQHALFVIRDGHLRVQTDQGAALFAPELLLHSDEASAQLGLVASPGDLFASQDGNRVALRAASAPELPTPTLLQSEALIFWWIPALAALTLLASSIPNIVGRNHASIGSLLDRLCAARAHGYKKMALHAERRRHPHLAAHWMGRASHWDANPELRMQHGIYLRLANRPSRALRAHHVADQSFRAEGVAHALNSYEASRAAARTGKVDEAVQWLLLAVREETWLARKAPFEPDLAPLRSRPEFMDLRLAADPDGLLRP